MTRDPLVSPRAGDILSNGKRTTRVLKLDRGMISCERYEPNLMRRDRVYSFPIALRHYRECAAACGVVVLAEGVPVAGGGQ